MEGGVIVRVVGEGGEVIYMLRRQYRISLNQHAKQREESSLIFIHLTDNIIVY